MRKQIMIGLTLASFIAVTASAGSLMEDYSRAGKWEVSGFGQYLLFPDVMGSEDVQAFGGGVSVGYNALDQLCINADLSVSSWEDESGSGPLGYQGGLSVDYNILAKRLTPFLTAGAGVLGWEESDLMFTGGLGAGVRWDATDRIFVKAAYHATWITDTDMNGSWFGHGFTLAVGVKF